jgi:hypothetical protein
VRWGTASRGWRGLGWLSPVEAVDGVAWMRSGAEEWFRRPRTSSTSSPECRGGLSFFGGC